MAPTYQLELISKVKPLDTERVAKLRKTEARYSGLRFDLLRNNYLLLELRIPPHKERTRSK